MGNNDIAGNSSSSSIEVVGERSGVKDFVLPISSSSSIEVVGEKDPSGDDDDFACDDSTEVESRLRADLAAIMRALYVRYVEKKRRTPEYVLDEAWPSWRNLAAWQNNSCHIDVVLDILTWRAAWLTRGGIVGGETYDIVKPKYRQEVERYVEERTKGNANTAKSIVVQIREALPEECGGANQFANAVANIQALWNEEHMITGRIEKKKISTNNKTVDITRDIFLVMTISNSWGTPVCRDYSFVFESGDSDSTDCVALGAIIGAPSHYRSALNVTAMASRMNPTETSETGAPIWYVFDHFNDRSGPTLRTTPLVLNGNENLVGLLLMKKA